MNNRKKLSWVIFASLAFVFCTDQKSGTGSVDLLSKADTTGATEIARITDSLSKIEVPDHRKKIDSIIDAIENDMGLVAELFSIVAMKKVRHVLTYQFATKNGVIQKIRRQFSMKKDTIIQEFYMQNGHLIFARETELSFYTEKNVTDTMIWRGEFYYDNGKLIDYVTLGHGKSEQDWWDPETAMQTAFLDSKRDIQRHRQRK